MTIKRDEPFVTHDTMHGAMVVFKFGGGTNSSARSACSVAALMADGGGGCCQYDRVRHDEARSGCQCGDDLRSTYSQAAPASKPINLNCKGIVISPRGLPTTGYHTAYRSSGTAVGAAARDKTVQLDFGDPSHYDSSLL